MTMRTGKSDGLNVQRATSTKQPFGEPDLSPEGAILAKGFAYGLFAVLVWGTYLAVSRAGVLVAGLLPGDFALFRFLPAGILGAFVLGTDGGRAKVMQIGWRRGTALTFCGGPLFIACATGGYLFAPLPHGAVIQPGSAVIAGLVLSHFTSDQATSRSTWLGAILIITGLVAANMSGDSRAFANAWIGDLLFVVAGVLWACFTVLLKRWRIDPVTGTSLVSVLALMVTAPLYGAFEGIARLGTIPNSQLVLQFTMQGMLAGFLAVVAFVKAVQLLGSARASLLPALVPVCAMLIGVPITGERPAVMQLWGLAIVTLGLLMALGAPRLILRAGRLS